MPIKSLKPITPGQRGRTVNGFDAITTRKPEKSYQSLSKNQAEEIVKGR